jgi:hypothetical protein
VELGQVGTILWLLYDGGLRFQLEVDGLFLSFHVRLADRLLHRVLHEQVSDQKLSVWLHDLADDEVLESVDLLLDHLSHRPLVGCFVCLGVETDVFFDRLNYRGY